ncbi:hypothetical protein HK098_007330 [Nowakowskiella sp. JEL0407]|nr:hypothetical protein HK098_007322 [Nowakowskiella sp. JEL0407]KAJ3126653.1 hypothetical protein HK098_007330 [Nowakowskiella sp. JEL0407]
MTESREYCFLIAEEEIERMFMIAISKKLRVCQLYNTIHQTHLNVEIKAISRPSDLKLYLLLEDINLFNCSDERVLNFKNIPAETISSLFNVKLCKPFDLLIEYINDPPLLNDHDLYLRFIVVAPKCTLNTNANFLPSSFPSPMSNSLFSTHTTPSPPLFTSASATPSPPTRGISSTANTATTPSPIQDKSPGQYKLPLLCKWKSPTGEPCGELFITGKLLLEHVSEDHIGRSSSGFRCLTCLWDNCTYGEAKKRHHIVQHIRKHIDDKEFVCDKCGEAFKHNQDLRLHDTKRHSPSAKSITARTLSSPVPRKQKLPRGAKGLLKSENEPVPPITDTDLLTNLLILSAAMNNSAGPPTADTAGQSNKDFRDLVPVDTSLGLFNSPTTTTRQSVNQKSSQQQHERQIQTQQDRSLAFNDSLLELLLQQTSTTTNRDLPNTSIDLQQQQNLDLSFLNNGIQLPDLQPLSTSLSNSESQSQSQPATSNSIYDEMLSAQKLFDFYAGGGITQPELEAVDQETFNQLFSGEFGVPNTLESELYSSKVDESNLFSELQLRQPQFEGLQDGLVQTFGVPSSTEKYSVHDPATLSLGGYLPPRGNSAYSVPPSMLGLPPQVPQVGIQMPPYLPQSASIAYPSPLQPLESTLLSDSAPSMPSTSIVPPKPSLLQKLQPKKYMRKSKTSGNDDIEYLHRASLSTPQTTNDASISAIPPRFSSSKGSIPAPGAMPAPSMPIPLPSSSSVPTPIRSKPDYVESKQQRRKGKQTSTPNNDKYTTALVPMAQQVAVQSEYTSEEVLESTVETVESEYSVSKPALKANEANTTSVRSEQSSKIPDDKLETIEYDDEDEITHTDTSNLHQLSDLESRRIALESLESISLPLNSVVYKKSAANKSRIPAFRVPAAISSLVSNLSMSRAKKRVQNVDGLDVASSESLDINELAKGAKLESESLGGEVVESEEPVKATEKDAEGGKNESTERVDPASTGENGHEKYISRLLSKLELYNRRTETANSKETEGSIVVDGFLVEGDVDQPINLSVVDGTLSALNDQVDKFFALGDTMILNCDGKIIFIFLIKFINTIAIDLKIELIQFPTKCGICKSDISNGQELFSNHIHEVIIELMNSESDTENKSSDGEFEKSEIDEVIKTEVDDQPPRFFDEIARASKLDTKFSPRLFHTINLLANCLRTMCIEEEFITQIKIGDKGQYSQFGECLLANGALQLWMEAAQSRVDVVEGAGSEKFSRTEADLLEEELAKLTV